MDDPAIAPAQHAAALSGLARLNRVSRSASIIATACRDLLARTPLRVLDLACGAGDVTVTLARRMRRRSIDVRIDGCDRSSLAVAHAAARAQRAGVHVRFFQFDALRDPMPEDYDVILCSLFLHHLDDADAVELLRRMAAAARRRILINDLHRTCFNLMLVTAGAHLLSRSGVVHADAPASVRAAFTAAELRALAARAGLRDVRIEPRFPARLLLKWDRNDA